MGALEVLKMNMGEDTFYMFCIMLVATLIITIVKKLLKLALVIGIIIAICMGVNANATTTPQPPTAQHVQSNYYTAQAYNPIQPQPPTVYYRPRLLLNRHKLS